MSKIAMLISLGIVMASGAAWIGFRQGGTVFARAPKGPKAVLASSSKSRSTAGGLPSEPALGNGILGPSGLLDRRSEVAGQLRAIFATKNAAARRAAFEELVDTTMDMEGLRGIAATLIEVSLLTGPSDIEHEWKGFWGRLAKRDPKTAVALIEGFGSDLLWNTDAASQVMLEWGSQDPLAAMRWLQGAGKLTGRILDDTTMNLIRGYARRDLKAATAHALSIVAPDEPFFGRMTVELTGDIMETGGVEKLRAWFAALPEGPAKGKFFDIVGRRLGKASPEQQRQWLQAEAGSPYRDDDSYRTLIREMAEADPKGALNYAFSLPTSPHQPGVFVGVGSASVEWLMNEPGEFENYYRSLPTGDQQQAIVRALEEVVRDPELPMKKGLPALRFLEGLK